MLILPNGARIGSVSGGCLEGELCRRAAWWTSEAPAVTRTFDTSTQEDNEGYGLGCGGAIDLLIERLPRPGDAATFLPLEVQERVRSTRIAGAVAVVTHAAEYSGWRSGQRFGGDDPQTPPEIEALLRQSLQSENTLTRGFDEGALTGCRIFAEAILPPIQLLICGAGTDAEPLARMAAELGWQILVLDRRPDLARASRFPRADRVLTASEEAVNSLLLDGPTAAIVMSHSFAQDLFFLNTLLPRPLGYLGVLGARRRTHELLASLGHEAAPSTLYAPAGLDVGAETPEQIALSILSEIQAVFAKRRGGSLRDRDGSIHGRELSGEGVTQTVLVRDCGS